MGITTATIEEIIAIVFTDLSFLCKKLTSIAAIKGNTTIKGIKVLLNI
jgi:hypothetical protein